MFVTLVAIQLKADMLLVYFHYDSLHQHILAYTMGYYADHMHTANCNFPCAVGEEPATPSLLMLTITVNQELMIQ